MLGLLHKVYESIAMHIMRHESKPKLRRERQPVLPLHSDINASSSREALSSNIVAAATLVETIQKERSQCYEHQYCHFE
jgi:hypothetical protein